MATASFSKSYYYWVGPTQLKKKSIPLSSKGKYCYFAVKRYPVPMHLNQQGLEPDHRKQISCPDPAKRSGSFWIRIRPTDLRGKRGNVPQDGHRVCGENCSFLPLLGILVVLHQPQVNNSSPDQEIAKRTRRKTSAEQGGYFFLKH